MLILLVRNSDLGQVHEDVLHLSIRSAALVTSQVIEPRPRAEQVVDDGDNNGDTDGVSPNDDNGNNGGISAGGQESVSGHWVRVDVGDTTAAKPAEDTEEGCEDIDTEDGGNELPRWPSVTTTGDEDQPILGQGDLEEEYALDVTEVLDDTTVGEEERSTNGPSTESK